MVTKWSIKELIASVKLNSMTVRRMTRAEQEGILNAERLVGSIFWNNTDNKLEIYHQGSDAVFKTQTVSNLLFRQAAEVGVTTEEDIIDETFISQKGIMENKVYFEINYIPQVSQAGEVEVEVTDGSTPVNTKDTFASEGSPTRVKKTFEVATTSFSIDDDLQVIVRATQAKIKDVVIRGV